MWVHRDDGLSPPLNAMKGQLTFRQEEVTAFNARQGELHGTGG